MILNDAGNMVQRQWMALPHRFQNIQLHECIVMPNHFHGIVGVPLVGTRKDAPTQDLEMAYDPTTPKNGQPQGGAHITLGDIVGAFKCITTHEYIRGVKTENWPQFSQKLWQRNYYEHIIRDEKSYLEISEYIQTNPAKWQDDKYFVT
ncbi:MAG: hypothetical protein L6301_16415 [Desulfobacteraceae bacterium]|nr:hypothetical protein [Desulfobacteraceae bacterium]